MIDYELAKRRAMIAATGEALKLTRLKMRMEGGKKFCNRANS